MTIPTRVNFGAITTLDPVLIQRATVFASRVGELNRNRNYVGEPHQPVTLVTDKFTEITVERPDLLDHSTDPFGKFVGMCWSGSDRWGPTVIWLSHINTQLLVPRSFEQHVETLLHELAHAYTARHHDWTFRRMYALLAPHIFELFGSRNADEHRISNRVDELIARYQRRHITTRSTGSHGQYTDYVDRWDRATEERSKHMTASNRMRDRLTRLGVRP